jgi:stage IV sporulation protein B
MQNKTLNNMSLVDKSGVLRNNKIEKETLENPDNLNNKSIFGLNSINYQNNSFDKNTYLIPCGNTIGVKLFTDGILVVGFSEFENESGQKTSPAKKRGVKKGDVIKTINDKCIYSVDDFILECKNKDEVKLEILRNNKIINFNIKSEKTADGESKFGMWVRDSTAGIGTMTFYNPKTKKFAALGHGICDIDTNLIFPLKDGEILSSSIVSVKKGEKGTPGELHGVFLESQGSIGHVDYNNQFGIYGDIVRDEMLTKNTPMKIALKEEVKEGDAYIMSNISGQKVKTYKICIQKTFVQNPSSTKGMIIKITDEELIKRTGGIVQGMSGSPIIQNGKLVGAVTHVFVNDPTRGYGIFIENMLSEAEKAN